MPLPGTGNKGDATSNGPSPNNEDVRGGRSAPRPLPGGQSPQRSVRACAEVVKKEAADIKVQFGKALPLTDSVANPPGSNSYLVFGKGFYVKCGIKWYMGKIVYNSHPFL